MDFVLFVIESILVMQITKLLLKGHVKTVYIFSKRWKYELVEAVATISIITVVFSMLGQNYQIYLGGIFLGFVQGCLEMMLSYQKDE